MDSSPISNHKPNHPAHHLADIFQGAYNSQRLLWLMAATVVFFTLLINSSWVASPDSALYLSLGESLAREGGYLFNGEPHTMVPPGYPALLAMAAKLMGPDFLSYRILMAITGLLTAGVGFIFVKRLAGKDTAIIIGAIFSVSHVLILNSTLTLSDVPFAFFALASLTLVISAGSKDSPFRWVVLAGFVSSIPPLIRINGLGIPPVEAFFLVFALRRHGIVKALLFAAIFLVIAWAPAICWQFYKSSFPASQSEGGYLTGVMGRSLRIHISVTLQALAALGPAIAEAVTGANIKTGFLEFLITFIVLLGMFRAWKMGDRLLTPLIVVQLAGLLVTSPGSRYVLFMIPGLLIMFFLGLELIGNYLKSGSYIRLSIKQLLIYAAILLMITNFSANILTWYHCRFPAEHGGAQTKRSKPYFKAARWLRENDPSAKVMTTRSRIIHYLSGCKTVALLRSGFPEQEIWVDEESKLKELYNRTRPDYLFTDQKDAKLYNTAIRAIESTGAQLVEIGEADYNDRFALYKIGGANVSRD